MLKKLLLATTVLGLGLASASDSLARATINENGVHITDENGWDIKLNGYAQYDHRQYLSDDAHAYHNNSTFRRVRPTLEVTNGDFLFNFSPDLASSQGVIQDLYGQYKFSPEFSLRGGKFKEPIGLDVLKSDRDTLFVERSLPSNLLPSRDIGLMAYGDILPEFSYDIGVFNGVPDRGIEDSNQDNNYEFAARLTAKPLDGLGTGISATHGEKDGSLNPQVGDYRSPAQARVFRYSSGVFANGDHTRYGPFAYYYNGPFAVNAEYIVSDQEVSNGTLSESLANTAWEVQLGWVFTGEDAVYKGWPKAEEQFNPLNGNWGAWEVGVKYGELDVDDAAFPAFASINSSVSEEHAWGVVLNGYLTPHVKVSLDFENTSFTGGAAGGADRETEHAVLTRVQYKF